ncbi:Rrf2 family transcriptional regulator [Holzapfeliella sp. JNUCC 72]
MKYSIQFSDAIHILLYIEMYQDTDYLSSAKIAESIQTNPANVRKIMGQLKKSQLIETEVGKAKPRLSREINEITLLDVYQSIEGNTNLIQVDQKTNVACVVGANIQEILEKHYNELQQKIEHEMSKIKLSTLVKDIALTEYQKRPQNYDVIEKYLN